MPAFTVSPLAGQPLYGCEVSGLDPATIAEPAVRRALHDLWIDKGLIVFRGIGSAENQLALSHVFGEPEVHPMMAGTDIKTEHKALTPVEFDRDDGNIYRVDGEERGGYLSWHFDGAYVDRINHGGILRPLMLPRHGGETGFIDQIAAWERLPGKLKAQIEGLSVIYAYQPDMTRSKFGTPPEKLVRMASLFKSGSAHPSVQVRAIHPLVYTQAETGKQVLHISPWFAEGIEGMENAEGDALLAEVIGHVLAPDLMYFHKWRADDMLLWDNWRMLHCAKGCPPDEPRIMRRTTIVGDYGLGRREVAPG